MYVWVRFPMSCFLDIFTFWHDVRR
jgi:hypothetical protein